MTNGLAVVEDLRGSIEMVLEFAHYPGCKCADAFTNLCNEHRLREALERTKEYPARPDDQIKHMVNRFLGWRLPINFNPDGGISFKRHFNEQTDHPMQHEPTGTNLLDATQAEEMVRYMVERPR